MKKSKILLTSLVCLTLLFSLAFLPASAAMIPKNILLNSSFADGDDNWDFEGTTPPTISGGAVNFGAGTSDWSGVKQTVTVKPNTWYRLYFTYNVSSDTAGRFQIDLGDDGAELYDVYGPGNYYNDGKSTYIPGNMDEAIARNTDVTHPYWRVKTPADMTSLTLFVKREGEAKVLNGKIVSIKLVEQVADVGPDVMVEGEDDGGDGDGGASDGGAGDGGAAVTEKAFKNGSFENGFDDWTFKSGLGETGHSINTNAAGVSDGSKSWYMDGTQTKWSGIYQDVTVKKDKYYKITYDTKLSQGRVQLYAAIVRPDETEGDRYIGNYSRQDGANSEYNVWLSQAANNNVSGKEYFKALADGTVRICVEATTNEADTDSAKGYIDNVKFFEVDANGNSLSGGGNQSAAGTGTVKGRLVDGNGAPLSGVTLMLKSDPVTTTTNSNGEFQFNDVPAGTHTLYLVKDDGTEIQSNLSITVRNQDIVELKAVFDGTNLTAEIVSVSTGEDTNYIVIALAILSIAAAAVTYKKRRPLSV